MDNSTDLKLTLKLDAPGVKANLTDIGASVKQLGQITGTALAKDGGMGILGVKNFAEVKAEMAKLTTAYRSLASSGKASAGEQAKALDALRNKQRELYATISNPPKLDLARSVLGISSQQSIVSEINKVKQAYATLATSGKANLAELSRAKIAMGQRLDELKQKTNNWRDALGQIKGKVIEAAAASAGIILSAKAAVDFESAMADVRKVVDGSPEEIAALGRELQELTRTIPLTAIELARIATSGGQLGIAAKDILPFVEVTAKMATAFDMTADEAGEAIGKLKNVFNLSIEEIASFGDAINQLGNTSAAREKDIVQVMLRVGGTSRQFGLAKEQTAALAAAMLSLGKPPEIAATSINTLLNRMQTATMQSGDFQEALAKIGMSADEMAASVAKNPQQALTNLLETLAKLDGQNRAEVLTGLFGREFQDDIGVLVGSLQTYRDTLIQVGDENAYAGAMLKEFSTRAATTKNQLILLKNEIVRIATNIGTGLLPFIKATAKVLVELLKPISDLTGAFPKLSAAVVAIGTGALVFSTVAKAAGIMKAALAIVGSDTVAALGGAKIVTWGTSAVTALKGVQLAALSTAGALGAAAGASLAVFAGYAIGKKIAEWEYFSDVVKANKEALSEVPGKFAAISQATGVTIRSFKDLDKAQKEGLIQFNSATGAWEKVSKSAKTSAIEQTKAQKQATEEMKKAYQAYADTVKKLQDDIAGRERSLAEQLRDMDRSGMSAEGAWKDRKAQAEEFATSARKAEEAAKAAFAAGDTAGGEQKYKEAVDLYDKAKEAAAELNTEIRNGDQVIQTQAESLKTAKSLVKEYGDAGIEAEKKYTEAIKQTAAAMDRESGGTLSKDLPEAAKSFGEVAVAAENLVKTSDEFNKAWKDSWDRAVYGGKEAIAQLESDLKELTKDRHIKVYVQEVQQRAAGGMIGALHMAGGGAVQTFRNMLSGGHFPGFGGGDRRHVVAEDGEYMLDKFRVKDAGLNVVRAFHAGRYDVVVSELMKKMRGAIGRQVGGIINRVPILSPIGPQFLQAGGAVQAGTGIGGDVYNLNLNFTGQVSQPSRQNARELATMVLTEFKRMNKGASK